MPTMLAPPYEILDSIVSILTEAGHVATGFRVRCGADCFLVTARHAMPDSETAHLRMQSMYEKGAIDETLARADDGTSDADVAAFRIPFTGRALDIERVSDEGIYLAQDVLALGFPGGTRYVHDGPGGFLALPLVKKGVLAAIASQDRPMYLDLIANPGFSGGPVLFAPHHANEIRICGMISQTATVSAIIEEDAARKLLAAAGISTAISPTAIRSVLPVK